MKSNGDRARFVRRYTSAVATAIALTLAACGGDIDMPNPSAGSGSSGSDGGSSDGSNGNGDGDGTTTVPAITLSETSYLLETGSPFKLNPAVNMVASGWAIAPALPAGLALDTTSGEIAGMTTMVAPLTRYTLTAQTTAGPASAEISLRSVGSLVPAGDAAIVKSLEVDGVWYGMARGPATLSRNLGYGVFVDPATGQMPPTGTQPFLSDPVVQAFADPQRPGGLFVLVNSLNSPRMSIKRIGADGGRDPDWPMPTVDGQIHVLAVKGHELLIAGRFEGLEVAGVSHSRRDFAAVNLASGQPTQWAPQHTEVPSNNSTSDMAVNGDTVYLTGWYGLINGVDCSGDVVCAVRGTAGEETTNWRPTVSGGSRPFINLLQADGDRILIIGRFEEVNADRPGGGLTRRQIAAVDKTTGEVIAGFEVNPPFDANGGPYLKPVIHGGRLIVPLQRRIVALDLQTGALQWSSVDLTQGSIRDIAVVGDRVIACHDRPGTLSAISLADGSGMAVTGEVIAPDGCSRLQVAGEQMFVHPDTDGKPFTGEPLNTGSPGLFAVDLRAGDQPLVAPTQPGDTETPQPFHLTSDGTYLFSNQGGRLRVIDRRTGNEITGILPIVGTFETMLGINGKLFLHGELSVEGEPVGADTLLELDIATRTLREFAKADAGQRIHAVAIRDDTLYMVGDFDSLRIGDAPAVTVATQSLAIELATAEPRPWALQGADLSRCRTMHWVGERVAAICRFNTNFETLWVFDEAGQRVTGVAELLLSRGAGHDPVLVGDSVFVYLERWRNEYVLDPVDGRLDGSGLALIDVKTGQGRVIPGDRLPRDVTGINGEISLHRIGERLLLDTVDFDGVRRSGFVTLAEVDEIAGPAR